MFGQTVLSLVIFLSIQLVASSNILFISPVPSPSHHIFNRVLAVGLAEKGHNVTFLSANLHAKPTKNVHYLHLDTVYNLAETKMSTEQIIEDSKASAMESTYFIYQMCLGMAVEVMNSTGLKAIMDYPKDFKFDAVIYDFTAGPFLLPLVTRFDNPPLIAVTAFVNPPYTTEYVGGHKYPAFIPHYAMNYRTDMNFFQRFYNTFIYVFDSM